MCYPRFQSGVSFIFKDAALNPFENEGVYKEIKYFQESLLHLRKIWMSAYIFSNYTYFS